jgi:hypothetical protein
MTWIGLRHLHVPENRRSELEHVADVLAEGRRLEPFPPRHVGHFAESDFLDLAGELLAFRFIASAHPVGDELLELRDVRPAEPGARARARQAEVYGGIDDVRRQPPREKQVPAALVGRLLACQVLKEMETSTHSMYRSWAHRVAPHMHGMPPERPVAITLRLSVTR